MDFNANFSGYHQRICVPQVVKTSNNEWVRRIRNVVKYILLKETVSKDFLNNLLKIAANNKKKSSECENPRCSSISVSGSLKNFAKYMSKSGKVATTTPKNTVFFRLILFEKPVCATAIPRTACVSESIKKLLTFDEQFKFTIIFYYISLKIVCIRRFLSLILSSKEIIDSVLYTPSISSSIKITSLAWRVFLARILQKTLYFPVVMCATVT